MATKSMLFVSVFVLAAILAAWAAFHVPDFSRIGGDMPLHRTIGPSADDWQPRDIQIPGATIRVFATGTGPPVLLHPSLGRGPDDFKALAKALAAAGYQAVAMAPRGIAASTGSLHDLTQHDCAKEMWAVADALKLDRVHLIGQAFGNRIVRTASAHQPDRVLSITLLAAGGEVSPSKETLDTLARCFDLGLSEAEHMDAVKRSFFAPGNDPAVWKGGWFPDAATAQHEATKKIKLPEWYLGGTARMHIIQGLDDVIAPPVNGWNLVQRRPWSTLTVLPSCGHAMLPEQPEALAAAVIGFLRMQPEAGYGQELYRLVRVYAEMGVQRTGMPGNARTINWFAAELERRGGKIERQSFSFDYYDADTQVTIDGRTVESLPLYYEGVGELRDDKPFVAAANVMDGHGTSKELAAAIADAGAAGAKIAVVACTNPLGEITAPNRYPKLGSGLPVVLIPGREATALKTGKVQVKFSARIGPRRGENVVAAFGDVTKSPIVITTPLSGWFACASERGTGVAVALALAQRLAPRHPVLVVGTSGHELLHHIGLKAYLKDNKLAPALVLHLGANVALGQKQGGAMRLIETRGINVRMAEKDFSKVRAQLKLTGVEPKLNPEKWYGEGELWFKATDAPLISVVGTGPQFHTPADTPENTTSPELMRQVYEAIGGALNAWLAGRL